MRHLNMQRGNPVRKRACVICCALLLGPTSAFAGGYEWDMHRERVESRHDYQTRELELKKALIHARKDLAGWREVKDMPKQSYTFPKSTSPNTPLQPNNRLR
jgi:hypothetical protein